MPTGQRIGIRMQAPSAPTQAYFAVEAGGLGGVGVLSLAGDTPYSLNQADVDDLGGGVFEFAPSGQFSLAKLFSFEWTFWFAPTPGAYSALNVQALVGEQTGDLVADILLDDGGVITELFSNVGNVFEGPFSTQIFSASSLSAEIIIGSGAPPPDFWTSFTKTFERK